MNTLNPVYRNLGAKKVLQRVINPFLRMDRPQRRFIILHDILPDFEPAFQNLLKWALTVPAHQQIMFTFDDGFYSSFEAIKFIPPDRAIFFICPEYINRSQTKIWQDFFYHNLLRTESLDDPKFRDAVRPASWDQLRELVKLGYHIGSHSMTHTRLSSHSSLLELEREIIGSAQKIEDELNAPVDAFAYPFGRVDSVDRRSLEVILRRFKHCFTGIRGNNASTQASSIVWRDTIHFEWPLDYQQFLLSGGFDWYYASQRRIIQKMIIA